MCSDCDVCTALEMCNLCMFLSWLEIFSCSIILMGKPFQTTLPEICHHWVILHFSGCCSWWQDCDHKNWFHGMEAWHCATDLHNVTCSGGSGSANPPNSNNRHRTAFWDYHIPRWHNENMVNQQPSSPTTNNALSFFFFGLEEKVSWLWATISVSCHLAMEQPSIPIGLVHHHPRSRMKWWIMAIGSISTETMTSFQLNMCAIIDARKAKRAQSRSLLNNLFGLHEKARKFSKV